MLQRVKLFGLSLIAALAVGGAVLSMSASALPSVLPENVAEDTWSGASTSAAELIKHNGGIVKCGAWTASGREEIKKPLGLFHITFTSCTTAGGLAECTGLGDTSGKILSLGSWHLVFDTLGATLGQAGVAILFLLGDIHVECGAKLILVFLGGMVLCLITNPTTKQVTHQFKCEKGSNTGEAREKTYYSGNGTLINISTLESEENNSGIREESVEFANGTITYSVAVEMMV